MKKTLTLCFAILFSLTLLICTSADEEAYAKEIKFTYVLETSNGSVNAKNKLADKDYTTTVTLDAGEVLHISCEESAAWINIKFYGKAPESYMLGMITSDQSSESQITDCGGIGFLHQVNALAVGTSEILISGDTQMSICEIEVYSAGKLPDSVQRWEKSLSRCDVLVISTHADDDTLFFGALSAEQIALGRSVQTAFICGHPGELHRLNELLDGQWTLGVTAYPIIGSFNDYYSTELNKAEQQYDCDKMSEFIVEVIRRTRPLVLVTHDIDGEYGHGAHRLVSKLTREALKICDDASVYTESAEKYGTHAPQKTYLHLYDKNKIVLGVNAEYEKLDSATPFETAKAAYKCHKSQQQWRFKVTTSGTDDCRRFGLYQSLVECDVTDNDIMNGLSPILPTVSSTSTIKKSNECRNINTNTSPAHKSSDRFELFSIFSHDGNGNQTKVPTSSVAICLGIIILFAAYGLYSAIKNLRR